jgi:cytochrome c oxidase subunit II
VTFVVYSVAVIAWSLSVLRWSASIRRGRGKMTMCWLSWATLLAASGSIASDLRSIGLARSASISDLDVRIVRRGDWWQLDYSRGGVVFRTANELHVPAGERLSLEWSGVQPPWTDNGICFPGNDGEYVLIAGAPSVRDVRFAGIWPPSWRRLPMVIQSSAQFDRWFAGQAQPARNHPGSQGALFRNSGCAYCHVIRGLVNEPWRAAPDLTHFASRATIAATSLPNRHGQLSGWVVHSRSFKPDSEMPDNALAPDDLRAIVALLESLR